MEAPEAKEALEELPLDAYYERALQLARDAGAIIRERNSQIKNYLTKTGATDLVTETDLLVERHVMTGLKQSFPCHKFIGEESAAGGEPVALTDAPTWIVDPVDGTMNFVHGYPNFCVSIALWMNREPCIGVVHNPLAEQLFSARAGRGCFLNGERIACSKEEALDKSLLLMELGSNHDADKMRVSQTNLKTLMPLVHGVRVAGSCALDMAMVAKGAADAFFDFGLHAWDVAAGTLLVREAGGTVMDPAGGPLDPLARRVLCTSTMALARALVPLLHQRFPMRD